MKFIEEKPAADALLSLYQAVGWTNYTDNPEKLIRAFEGSQWVLSAYDADVLVGVLRAITDGETILYIQDILVNPDQQRRGIGRQLVQHTLERFRDVRQKVLLTDDRAEQKAFYADLGFSNVAELQKVKLNAFVRIEGVTLE